MSFSLVHYLLAFIMDSFNKEGVVTASERQYTRYTKWGRVNMLSNEFYFRPKFSVNYPPIAEDGVFVEDVLEVMLKFDPYEKRWVLRGIWNPELERVYVDEDTLKNITLQGRFRVNLALDSLFNKRRKDVK